MRLVFLQEDVHSKPLKENMQMPQDSDVSYSYVVIFLESK